MSSFPLRTRKKSSVSSCLCQTNSPFTFTTIRSWALSCATVLGDQYSENVASFSVRLILSLCLTRPCGQEQANPRGSSQALMSLGWRGPVRVTKFSDICHNRENGNFRGWPQGGLSHDPSNSTRFLEGNHCGRAHCCYREGWMESQSFCPTNGYSRI